MNDISFTNDKFYISYAANREEFVKSMDELAFAIGGRKPQDRDETALCVRNANKWSFYILYGDHREAYGKLVPDLQACIQYFKDNYHLLGHSSDTIEQLETVN